MLSTATRPGVTVSPVQRRPSELRRILDASVAPIALFALLYLGFLSVYVRFPYVQSGADIVARAKHQLACTGQPFRSVGGQHVVIFGNSKVLSGFIPEVFDEEIANLGWPGMESYNFGLPGDDRFVADLEALIARGKGPNLVLLTVPWQAAGPKKTVFHFLDNDKEIVDRLFPFRKLWREFFLLAAESKGRPGQARRIYLENERTVNKVAADRGYYFIARQSHYANDELPAGLSLSSDTPQEPFARFLPAGPVFDRLLKTFYSHHIRCVFVPMYFREGQYAPPPPLRAEDVRAVRGQSLIGFAGPQYLQYPNSLFADFTHTNPRGALVYTRDVARFVAEYLSQQARR